MFILPGDSAPLAEVSDKVVKVGCRHLQIMLCPFLHIQQMLVSVAPATAPIFGGNMSAESREGGEGQLKALPVCSGVGRAGHLSKRGTVSMISRFHTAAPTCDQ